jgi:hypothetical protein
MKAVEAAKIVAWLAAVYRDTKVSPETSAAYESLLADLDYDLAQQAVKRLAQTSKWLPSVAEIRTMATDIERGPVRCGGEAYGDVIDAIRSVGSYRPPPEFSDPVVAECVRLMTWRGLCMGDNEAADRARFIELYNGLAARRRADSVAGRALPEPKRGFLPPGYSVLRLLPDPKPVEAKPITAAELDTALGGRRGG